jgi:hypothetical protein
VCHHAFDQQPLNVCHRREDGHQLSSIYRSLPTIVRYLSLTQIKLVDKFAQKAFICGLSSFRHTKSFNYIQSLSIIGKDIIPQIRNQKSKVFDIEKNNQMTVRCEFG